MSDTNSSSQDQDRAAGVDKPSQAEGSEEQAEQALAGQEAPEQHPAVEQGE